MKDAKGHGSFARGVAAIGQKIGQFAADERGGTEQSGQMVHLGMKVIEEIAREHGIEIGHLVQHMHNVGTFDRG